MLPEKAVFWKETRTLLLADLHLGKIHHFRKSGIPLPLEAQFENFDRLSYLLLNMPVRRVMILGDLFHSSYNESWEAFKAFLYQFSEISFHLVRGNHDILGTELYRADNLRMDEKSYSECGFIFTHHPLRKPECYNFCGHIHPGIKLSGAGRQAVRLPCYYFGESQAILPSFGTFTGMARITPGENEDVYAIADSRVIKVL